MKPIPKSYPIEFVKDLVEIAVKRATGLPNDQVKVTISEDYDVDAETETPLSCIEVSAGWVSFELCETMIVEMGDSYSVGYQPTWSRGVPARGMNPPDVDIHEGPIYKQPASAIEEGLVRCLRETLNNACNDALMYQDWLEEKGASA